MAPVIPNRNHILSFETAAALEAWIASNHATAGELWLKVFKKGSTRPTVTVGEALDIALCWGWIDGIRKSLDEHAFLQRYTPRTPKSIWSQINREHVARLTAAGRMTPHGQRQIDAAKADGRWDAAYAPARDVTVDTIPPDLRAAINADPRAKKALATLGRQDLFALVFRTSRLMTPAGRAKKIAALVDKLARDGSIVAPAPSPEPVARKPHTKSARAASPSRRAR